MRASDERRNGRERRGNQEPDHDDNSQQPAPNVLPEQQTTTKAGKPRQRIAWTTKMNEDIMHCYYTATKLDTLKTGYRTDFHRLFIQLYPQYEHKITAQRISDQKRAIMTNKLLTDVNIENIKQEVANKIASIHNNNIEQNITQNPNNNNQINDLIDQNNNEEQSPNRNTNRAEITNNPNNDMIAKTLNEINTNLIKWEGVNPVSRPPIPKLIFKKDTIKYIETINNTILPTMLNYNSTIENIHTYIYVAAITTTILNNQHPITQNNKIFNSGKHKWQIRIENKVNEFRRNLGRLTQYKNGNRSKNIIKHINVLQQKNNKPLDEIIDTHKQKLKVYAARLTRYKESNQRRTDNKLFTNNQKTFYKKLASKEDFQIIPLTKEQITNYWKNIWSIPTQHNESATWIRQEEHRQKDLQPQHNIALSTEELTNIINKTHNWKCPGIDNVQNFWYKKFTSTHHHLALAINKIIDQPQTLQEFLTIGKTYIKPKNNETTNPSNYRPITCLPTLYKIITSTISSKIETHLTQQNVITDEQKGCKKNSQGCKEQLIIDTTIMKQATSKQRNLHSC
ncbi:putative mediator of RNA polymerase II transcription subunit 24 [Anastrepha obliqua]|uniref:putative mediator of RNA polymerase II transcription subunit 24 n=1 Tax=Anastrepha obliqua TaxID=95512 RepID=UPI002409A270|nr:putative mediator of RNA polymerase II transcription subunit 24 [Anastrepha obliqua]